MKLRIRNQQDFAAGLIYLVGGTAFAIGGLGYKVGEAARMGPGYFPFCVGVLLALVGLLTLRGAVSKTATPARVKPPELAPLAWVLGGVVLFGLLLQPAGLVAALVVLVIVSSRASHEFTWKAAIINAVLLTVFSLGVFVWGINLQLPLWPAFLR